MDEHLGVQWYQHFDGLEEAAIEQWTQMKLASVDLNRFVILGSETERIEEEDDVIFHAYLHDLTYDRASGTYRAHLDNHPATFGSDHENTTVH